MKQVAGIATSRLGPISRLEAFAQFGSDLDKVTQAQLARGTRLVEILKQPQYEPMAAEKQIAVIFAATNGYVDEYDVRMLMEYERQYLSHLESSYPDVLTEIREKKIISADLESKMKKILDEFRAIFNPPSVSLV